MVAAVRMGGWVLIEDADFSSLRAVEATHPLAESHDRHLRDLLDRLTQAKLSDPYLGGRVRGLLEDAGLTEVDNEGVSRIAQGGETEAKMLCMTLQALVERDILSAAAYSAIQQALLDPSFSFITLTIFAAWGKRASATFRKFTPKRTERHHKVLESTRLRHTPFARKMYTLNTACI
jgi:hypothetical protein